MLHCESGSVARQELAQICNLSILHTHYSFSCLLNIGENLKDSVTLAEETVQRAIEAHAGRPGALLPLLHEIQDRLAHIPDSAVPAIAKALNLSRAEVHGVITFYHHFRQTPPGKHVVQICRAEACQAVGANELVQHAKKSLRCELHATTPDGEMTLEPVYCLGQCATGPAIMIDDALHARVDSARFDQLVASCKEAS